MRNVIIQFRARKGPRGHKQTQEPSPHGPSRQFRLQQQIARVTALVEELEGIAHGESDVPPKLLWQARVGIDKTRDILRALPGYLSDSEREADPQPDIDRAVLERLYGCLD